MLDNFVLSMTEIHINNPSMQTEKIRIDIRNIFVMLMCETVTVISAMSFTSTLDDLTQQAGQVRIGDLDSTQCICR